MKHWLNHHSVPHKQTETVEEPAEEEEAGKEDKERI